MAVHDIVVVGFSAGGIDPLRRFVGALPADFPGAMFVVHHFPPQSVSALPSILKRVTTIPVDLAADRAAIAPGRIYVARPDHDLVLEPGRVRLADGPPAHHPTIDPLFRSAAQAYGARVAGVILSGTLGDGTAGLLEIKAHGGVALVQQPEEASYPGMSLSAIRNVPVDYVASAQELAAILDRLARPHEPQPAPSGGFESPLNGASRGMARSDVSR